MAHNRRPNVIFLVLDALRAKQMSAYGYPRPTTPRLDAFAEKAILFRHPISAATWTIPAHASLLTGLYVSQHRIESIEADRSFHPDIVTLPEALRRHGYRTAAFSQNMLFGPENHLEQGFDEFHNVDDILRQSWLTRRILNYSDTGGKTTRLVARYLRKMVAPRRMLGAMQQWIGQQEADQPFFLMANILEPHFPWTVPPSILLRQGMLRPRSLMKQEYLTLKKQWEYNSGKRPVTAAHREHWQKFYDAALMHADRELGQFFTRLEAAGMLDNTIVIVTADHGEMLGDYRNLVGHLLCLHDNLIRVPLIIRHPDFAGGQTIEGVVQTLDLYPSILDWTGCDQSNIPAPQCQRPSLNGRLHNPTDTSGYAFSEEDYTDSYDVIGKLRQANPEMAHAKYPHRQVAVRSTDHKFIWYDDRPAEFYDLRRDPDEQHDLIDTRDPEQQQTLAEMRAAMHRWSESLEIYPPVSRQRDSEMDEAVLGRLRALGYVL